MFKRTSRRFPTGLALASLTTLATPAFAGGVALQLNRATLTNVADAAGLWQHEGGTILKAAVTVGNYAIIRRVTNGGTTPINSAVETVQLMFSGTGTPAQNLTLQGTHNFSNGIFFGGVSATSIRYTFTSNGQATISPTATANLSNLTILWNGSNTLTLP